MSLNRGFKRNIKKVLKAIVNFCTDSPFEYESNDIKDRKVAKIFEHAVDYYYTMAICNPTKLAQLLAKRDMQLFLNDMDKIYKAISENDKRIIGLPTSACREYAKRENPAKGIIHGKV